MSIALRRGRARDTSLTTSRTRDRRTFATAPQTPLRPCHGARDTLWASRPEGSQGKEGAVTTNQQTSQCPACHQRFRDDDALRQHGLRAHFDTRQQHEERRADAVMADAVDRQQDHAGRRETAGQPGDAEQPGSERDRERMNAARPREDIAQQTQQQQRQVE